MVTISGEVRAPCRIVHLLQEELQQDYHWLRRWVICEWKDVTVGDVIMVEESNGELFHSAFHDNATRFQVLDVDLGPPHRFALAPYTGGPIDTDDPMLVPIWITQ